MRGPAICPSSAVPATAAGRGVSQASALIVGEDRRSRAAPFCGPAVPTIAFARALELFHPITAARSSRVSPLAAVGEGVDDCRRRVGRSVRRDWCRRADRRPRPSFTRTSQLATAPRVGADCVLHAHVSVRERVALGDRVDHPQRRGHRQRRLRLHPGARRPSLQDSAGRRRGRRGRCGDWREHDHRSRLGRRDADWRRAPRSTTSCRSATACSIGRDVLLAAQVGISGSTTLEDRVTLGGQVGVQGHITIGKGVVAAGQSGVTNSVEPGRFLTGYPAIDNRQWRKASVIFARLPELRQQLVTLQQRLDALEAQAARTRKRPVRSGQPRRRTQGPRSHRLSAATAPDGPFRPVAATRAWRMPCAIIGTMPFLRAVAAAPASRVPMAAAMVVGLACLRLGVRAAGRARAAAQARIHDDQARQRALGGVARGSLDADRARRAAVPRRLEERAAGPHRVRAPLRAPDVPGQPERQPGSASVVHRLGRRREQRHDQRGRDGLLGDDAGAVPAARALARGRSDGQPEGRRERLRSASAASSRKSAGRRSRARRTGGSPRSSTTRRSRCIPTSTR